MWHSSLVDGKNVVWDAVEREKNNSDCIDKDHSIFMYENSITEPERTGQQTARERKRTRLQNNCQLNFLRINFHSLLRYSSSECNSGILGSRLETEGLSLLLLTFQASREHFHYLSTRTFRIKLKITRKQVIENKGQWDFHSYSLKGLMMKIQLMTMIERIYERIMLSNSERSPNEFYSVLASSIINSLCVNFLAISLS